MAEAAGPGLVDLLRLAGALVVVLALAVLASRVLRRGMRPRSTRRLQIEDRLSVSRGVQIAVVADGGRRFLVGISDKGVGLVSELDGAPDAADEDAQDDAGEPASFAVRLAEQLRRVAHGRDAA